MARRQLLEFPSRTGIGTIQARLYLPDNQGHCTGLLIQIVHGLAEHMARYDQFCQFLADQGHAVCIQDLAGHGQSAPSPAKMGFFGEHDGWELVLEDIAQLYNLAVGQLQIVQPEQKGWRQALYGHSMGAFICECYCARYGSELSGVVLSGTSGKQLLLPLGLYLAARSVKKHGPLYKDGFLEKLNYMGNLKKIKNPRTKFDWLTRDPAVVDAYIADPQCGFTFTAAGYRDLYRWLQTKSSAKWAGRVPVDLSFLIFSGDQDPISQYGHGSREVCNRLRKTGHLVELKIYSGRHEMHNETNKDEVWQDVQNWFASIARMPIKGQERGAAT